MPRSATSEHNSGGVCSSAARHRADDAGQRFMQGFEDFVGIDREHARHAFGEVAPGDFDLLHVRLRIGAADLDLDAFGGGLADQHAVLRRT
jgi:hypothetical protein